MRKLFGFGLPYPGGISFRRNLKFGAKHYAGLFLRKFGSVAPKINLVPKSNSYEREKGISAIMPVMNEEYIEPALLSTKDIVNEYVIVDSSTDETPEVIRGLKDKYNLNIRHLIRNVDILEALNLALSKSSCSWILKWEGDAIAYKRMEKILNVIKVLGPQKYFVFFPPLLNMEGIQYISDDVPYNIEPRLFKWSPHVKYVRSEEGIDALRMPFFYEKIPVKFNCALHLCRAKDKKRLIWRKYHPEWINADKSKHKSFEDFVEKRLQQDYGTTDIDELPDEIEYIAFGGKGQIKIMADEHTIPYQKGVYGDYPEELKAFVKKEYDIDLDE